MTTYFMLSEVCYSYNDSIYETPSTNTHYSDARGASQPVKLFKTKESAEAAVKVLTLRHLRCKDRFGVSFHHYFYNIAEAVQDKDALYAVLKKYRFSKKTFEQAVNWSRYSDEVGEAQEKLNDFIDRVVHKMSDEELMRLVDATNVRFFVVHPVEVVEKVDLLTSPQEWERDIGKQLHPSKS